MKAKLKENNKTEFRRVSCIALFCSFLCLSMSAIDFPSRFDNYASIHCPYAYIHPNASNKLNLQMHVWSLMHLQQTINICIHIWYTYIYVHISLYTIKNERTYVFCSLSSCSLNCCSAIKVCTGNSPCLKTNSNSLPSPSPLEAGSRIDLIPSFLNLLRFAVCLVFQRNIQSTCTIKALIK